MLGTQNRWQEDGIEGGTGISGKRTADTAGKLRVCTVTQNTYNCRPHRRTTSKYKGVHLAKGPKRYRARIRCGDQTIHIGTFSTEAQAAKEYDKKAKDLFGEFAYLIP